jgi:release factor glutamine methyltransferase
VLANLPYVRDADLPALAPEIREWEPRQALAGGPDGLAAIRDVVPRVRADILALEVGVGQAPAVAELLRGTGFARVETRPDLAGIERVVLGRR